jgi:hypothetical protein
MNTRDIEKRLNKIAELVKALDEDLKAQYGEAAFVFFEADGIHAMKGDSDPDRGSISDRQENIIASASTYAAFGAGAW